MSRNISRRKRTVCVRQLTFARRGGARRGAGRKPKGATALVSHAVRPELKARFPVLVTMKLVQGLPSLRGGKARELVFGAFAASAERHGMRLVHFSIQTNHLHLLVEARDTHSLSRGMQGLCVRLARRLNRLWNRAGRVFADRFHSRILRTPREVRYALGYVLNNARKHGLHVGGIDPCSSGAAFDGWRERHGASRPSEFALPPPTRRARSWLLTVGWRRHGLIGTSEVPGAHASSKRAS